MRGAGSVLRPCAMIPWRLLARAEVPGAEAGGELRLFERGGELVIRAGAHVLMSSRASASEEALGTLAAARLEGRRAPRVLVAGLGMGFTLAAALRGLAPRAEVDVAELVPAVVEWNRGVLGPLAGHPLRDPRVSVREADVAAVLREAPSAWDSVLLDVDNGPQAIARRRNAGLYGARGLAEAHEALRPGGFLATWSASAEPHYPKRLRAAGFRVEEARVPSRRSGRGARRVVWIATRG